MRRRLLPHVCMLVTLLAWSSSDAAAKPATSWAQAELRAVVAAGLMAKEAAARPNDALTRGRAGDDQRGSACTFRPCRRRPPRATVTMSALDAKLVTTLGLSDTAKLFAQNAKASGLAPPVALRHRSGRASARPAHEPPRVARQARALPDRAGKPRRGGLLRRPHPPLRRVGRAGDARSSRRRSSCRR